MISDFGILISSPMQFMFGRKKHGIERAGHKDDVGDEKRRRRRPSHLPTFQSSASHDSTDREAEGRRQRGGGRKVTWGHGRGMEGLGDVSLRRRPSKRYPARRRGGVTGRHAVSEKRCALR